MQNCHILCSHPSTSKTLPPQFLMVTFWPSRRLTSSIPKKNPQIWTVFFGAPIFHWLRKQGFLLLQLFIPCKKHARYEFLKTSQRIGILSMVSTACHPLNPLKAYWFVKNEVHKNLNISRMRNLILRGSYIHTHTYTYVYMSHIYIRLGTFFFSADFCSDSLHLFMLFKPTFPEDTVQIYDIPFPQSLRIRSRILGGAWSTWAQLELNEEDMKHWGQWILEKGGTS